MYRRLLAKSNEYLAVLHEAVVGFDEPFFGLHFVLMHSNAAALLQFSVLISNIIAKRRNLEQTHLVR